MTEERTHDVVVHKADVPLQTGESIRAFTRALSDAGRDHVRKKLNLPDKDVDIFMVEAFAKSAVFDVFKFGPNVSQKERQRFYATSFTRKATGAFEFGPTTEVQRVTSFKPKAATVTKATTAEAKVCAGGVSVEQCACKSADGTVAKTCTKTKTKKSTQRQVFGNADNQWVETSKSFWDGAL